MTIIHICMINQNSTITKNDIKRIEASLKKVIEATKSNGVEEQYIQVLNRLVDVVADLRVKIEFDHEQRLRAIEQYLQEE